MASRWGHADARPDQDEASHEARTVWAYLAAAIAIGAVAASTIGLLLMRHREWVCSYRYWSDGARNTSAAVVPWLVLGAVGLGIVASLLALASGTRPRRRRDFVIAAIGLLPIIELILFVVVQASGHEWLYNCSTD